MNVIYDAADLLCQAAIASSQTMGVPMVIALADQHGELVHFHRMPGSLPASKTIAINKAYTAASLRMATDEVGRLAQPGATLYGVQHSLEGRAVLFGGGQPLRLAGQVIGAIGISGGTVPQDMEICAAVSQRWEVMTSLSNKLRPLLPEPLISELNQDPDLLDRLCGLISRPEKYHAQETMATALRLLPYLQA